MSVVSPPGAEPHHGGRSVRFYAAVAVFLALITLFEIGPLFGLYHLPGFVLVVLGIAKFFGVTAFFMHLWDDAAIFTRVFAVPLAGATIMVVALMAMFHTFQPSAKDDSFVIQERYAENWSGPCSSWVTSARTNRVYCASPPIERGRLALYTMGEGQVVGGPPGVDLNGKSEAEQLTLLRERGKEIYDQNCATCHQPQGEGLAGVYPPIAGSDYIADAANHVHLVINGLSGPITVNGQAYNGVMPAFGALNDYNIAAVITYERTSWGNDHGLVLPDQVREAR